MNMEFKKSTLEKIILDHNSVNVNPIVKEDCLRIIKDNSFLLNKLSSNFVKLDNVKKENKIDISMTVIIFVLEK